MQWKIVYDRPVDTDIRGVVYSTSSFLVVIVEVGDFVKQTREVCFTTHNLKEDYCETTRIRNLGTVRWHVDAGPLFGPFPVTWGTECFLTTEPLFRTYAEAMSYIEEKWQERIRDWEEAMRD